MYSSSFNIGSLTIKNRLIAAPMAGISDLPFRRVCHKYGVGLTFSEMFLADKSLWHTRQSQQKMAYEHFNGVNAVQIVGYDPILLAETAAFHVENGANLIDINMGCPAKKVNKKLAGSALLQYPDLVSDILTAVVDAVKVPVTVKIRTGWNKQNQNGVQIAKIAQDAGIKAITIHGRTRECLFKGHASYEMIKKVKEAVTIPIIANGDITTPEIAKHVFDYTGCDAIMIGRGALGKPWLFSEILQHLDSSQKIKTISIDEVKKTILTHISDIHHFYGEKKGVLIARKHVLWYTNKLDKNKIFWDRFSILNFADQQMALLTDYLSNLS